MPSFPVIRAGQVVMRLGSVEEKTYGTRIIQFEDDSEQRWVSSPPLARWTLALVNIDGYDLANFLEFWRSMKGRYDTTWDITVGGDTYSSMAFDQDDFTVTEPQVGRFSISLRVIQISAG